MKLKKYNDFIEVDVLVNESYGTSKEYYDFVKSKSIPFDVFDDSLFDVKQFAKINRYSYIIDSNGHTLNTEIDEKETYKILYNCQIQYVLNEGKNNFDKVFDNLNTIKISIEEMIDRVVSEGLKLKENFYLIGKVSDGISHSFIMSFTSDKIDTKELKDSFESYNKTQDKEYLDGLKDLRNIYKIEGIDFDKYMDTTDQDEYILIGIVIDDELYGIAEYNLETKEFWIDDDEVVGSINAYNEFESDTL